MAAANFFGRAAQSIGQIVKSSSLSELEAILSSVVVEIAYDGEAGSAELEKALDLLVRLLARLYPKLRLTGLGTNRLDRRLQRLARSINPEIEFSRAEPSITVLLGDKSLVRANPIIHLGSDGWVARVSDSKNLSFGNSDHAFGSGAAACLGAANVFRHTFAASLPAGGGLDADTELCLLDYCASPSHGNRSNESINLGQVHLVGAGAIGNGAIWALTRSNISAEIILVDHEHVELSNLQRYVLTAQRHVGKAKVEVSRLAAKGTRTRVLPKQMKWDEFASCSDYHFDTVLTALDTPEDRIAVQASLPRWIANAWTQTGDLGLSRHYFIGPQACLACLYWPTREIPSLDEVVASALHMTDQLMRIREMLYGGEPVGPGFIFEVAGRIGIDPNLLMPFADRRLMEFYQQAICGGLVLELADKSSSRAVEVPLVFQSALAGIMLAAEVSAHAVGVRNAEFPAKTVIDVTRPIPGRLSMRVVKVPNCICADPDFVQQYEAKYADH
jgi:hypothetical protein